MGRVGSQGVWYLQLPSAKCWRQSRERTALAGPQVNWGAPECRWHLVSPWIWTRIGDLMAFCLRKAGEEEVHHLPDVRGAHLTLEGIGVLPHVSFEESTCMEVPGGEGQTWVPVWASSYP